MRGRASQCPGNQTQLLFVKLQKPEIHTSASTGGVPMTSVLGGGGGVCDTTTVRVVVVVTGPVVVVMGPVVVITGSVDIVSGPVVVVVTCRVVTTLVLVGVRTSS